jgi:hypothetical protein
VKTSLDAISKVMTSVCVATLAEDPRARRRACVIFFISLVLGFQESL